MSSGILCWGVLYERVHHLQTHLCDWLIELQKQFDVMASCTLQAAGPSFYDFTAKDIDGNEVSMEKYKWVLSVSEIFTKCITLTASLPVPLCLYMILSLSPCVPHPFPHIITFSRDRVCIVVNVASKWGKTDVNYTELVQLHEKYEPQGLSILAFPCNQFGGQVGSEEIFFGLRHLGMQGTAQI